MPTPQLKVRSISLAATPPVFASQEKTAGGLMAPRSISAARCFGSTRGIFSGKPPPVMWASALIAPVSRIAFKSGFT